MPDRLVWIWEQVGEMKNPTLLVFALFAAFWMKQRLQLNHLWAALCLVGAVFFTFR